MINDIRLLKRISSDAYVFDAKSADDASSDRGSGLPATMKFILLAILAGFLAFAVWRIFFSA